MTTPLEIMAARREQRRAALRDAQLAALQARQGQTDAATEAGRANAQAAREQAMRNNGALYPGDVLVSDDPRIRRAARDGVGAPMVGFYGDGSWVEDGALSVTAGNVVTRAPAVHGVCVPELLVEAGLPYTATAAVADDAGFVGLQWVSADGMPLYPIAWARGPGVVHVTGTAPEGAFGLRMLLACWADPATVAVEDRMIMVDLTKWMATP